MTTAENQIGVNINLQKQDLNNLDISNLTPLSPEVISRQATINIGTIGHVAHGKSTVVKAISGVQTVRFKNELERNITIKLERISYDRILKISKSPALLREFESRQEKKIKRMQYMRSLSCRAPSIDSNFLHDNRLQPRDSNFIPRDISTSPSSGYESLNDNASNCSLELNLSLRLLRIKQCNANSISVDTEKGATPSFDKLRAARSIEPFTSRSTKRRIYPSSSGAGTPSSKRRKSFNTEYVVECIESIESINGQPVFFVKWLNYPEDQNTWESLSNLAECEALEQFIEKRYVFFQTTIRTINAEIKAEIESEALALKLPKFNVKQLDAYEPLLRKCDLILVAQFRDARSRSQKEPAIIRKRIIESILLEPFYNLRKKQLKDLNEWQNRMNNIENTAPVLVENNVDLEVLDKSFQYIKESFPGVGVKCSENPPIGCKCDDKCAPLSKCCARMAEGLFAYDKTGRLRIRPGEAIYECNNTCACDMTCLNRVIQRGRNNVLCLFKTSNGCGWGLRTERPLRKGEYVCDYVGEIITTEEANERGKQYDAIGRTYLFDLDYNTTAESVYTIDAAVYGNISHFINHSCDPNLAVFPFWTNNLDVNMPGLAFFTLRSINAGEELTFDYIRTDLNTDDYTNLSKAEKVTCRCGADNCRKVLF